MINVAKIFYNIKNLYYKILHCIQFFIITNIIINVILIYNKKILLFYINKMKRVLYSVTCHEINKMDISFLR